MRGVISEPCSCVCFRCLAADCLDMQCVCRDGGDCECERCAAYDPQGAPAADPEVMLTSPCATCECGKCEGFRDMTLAVLNSITVQMELNNKHLDVLAHACKALAPALQAIAEREGIDWLRVSGAVAENTKMIAVLLRALDGMSLVQVTTGNSKKRS